MTFTKTQSKHYITLVKTELKKSFQFITMDSQVRNYQIVVDYIQSIVDKVIPENLRKCFHYQLQNKLYSGFYCLQLEKEVEITIKSMIYRNNKLYITFKALRVITDIENREKYTPLLKEQTVIDPDSSSIILSMLVDFDRIRKDREDSLIAINSVIKQEQRVILFYTKSRDLQSALVEHLTENRHDGEEGVLQRQFELGQLTHYEDKLNRAQVKLQAYFQELEEI